MSSTSTIAGQQVLAWAKEQGERLTQIRRDLHRHPETGFDVARTVGVIEDELRKDGIDDIEIIDDAGLVATIHGTAAASGAASTSASGAAAAAAASKGAGPAASTGADPGAARETVALRADIDALPITEEHRTSYTSQTPGKMHACGHDFHTAGLIGAGSVLQAHRDLLAGDVKLIFQAAEEIGQGARKILRTKPVLDGVKRIFGLHTATDFPVGAVGIIPGPNNASVDHFVITITGESTHVSTPHKGVDALYIGAQIVVALQGLATRRINPIEPLIIGVGMFEAGSTYNALAASARLEGTTRCSNNGTRARIKDDISRLCEQIAGLYGGSAKLSWTDYATPLVNDPQVCEEAWEVAAEIFGADKVIKNRAFSLGGDDFAEYQLLVPGAYAYLCTANPDKPATCSPHHSQTFDVDEDMLPYGSALLATYAFRQLQ